MNKAIGERIRILRVSKSLSQENIANELGLSVGAYSNIERGKTEISVLRLYRLAKIFKTSPVSLLDIPATKKQDEVNDVSTEYTTVRKELNNLNEKVGELQVIIDNQKKEINYLKEIIVLLKGKKKSKK
jgi:transcriptional regulator with XRE-family HTH domain